MNSMDGSMQMEQNGGLMPLDPGQFDLSNATQAADFLSQLLDDSILQFDAQCFSRYFWYAIVVVIGLFAVSNLIWESKLFLRKRAPSAKNSAPATSTTLPRRLSAGLISSCRRATYPQLTPPRARLWINIPPLGTIISLFAYIGFILALEFIRNDVAGAQHWTSLGIRAGWLAIAQVPLLILLAGKNNLIGLVTGVSYARLNVYHRWVARSILLMAVLHMGLFNYSWNKWRVRSLEWATDSCVPTGFAAFGMLLWLNVSTLAPLRNFLYEVFVLQHLLTFFGFIIAIMYHLPSTALETRTYIWISIGLYVFDRLIRTGRLAWNNSKQGMATVEAFEGDVTKIRVRGSRLWKWRPGSFVLLSIPYYGVAQSHPATIASSPTSHDGDLVFLLRAHKGFTKNLLSKPNISQTSVLSASEQEKPRADEKGHRAFVDGPYGGIRDLGAFDTVLLVAGSTGITFALSVLLDLSTRAGVGKLPLRRLDLVWAVKHTVHTDWVSDELRTVSAQLKASGLESTFRIFVTRNDNQLTDPVSDSNCLNCHSSSSKPCSCETREEGTTEILDLQRRRSLSWARIESGRPNMDVILSDLLPQARGEMGVAVCGPLGMTMAVRRAVTHSMSAKQEVFLHVEGFSW